jgi:ABC-type oligopeptide transport system substrate-binding subunit
MVANAFFADFPSASQWLTGFLSCSVPPESNHSGLCDPAADRLAARASRLEVTAPLASNGLWAQADRRITGDAPWVPTVQELSAFTVGKRVGNFRYLATSGPLIDQFWLR